MNLKKLIISIVVSLLLANNAYAENKDTLVIGKVSPTLNKEDHAAMKVLVENIAEKMSVEGIEKTDVYLTKTVPEMIEAIKTGKVDWVSDSLYVSLVLAEKTRAEAFLSKNRKIRRYSSVFFVAKNRSTNSIKNLDKKIVLFSDALTTNGYFVPFYELTNYKYVPRIYGQKDTGVSSDKKRIFYRFEVNKSAMIKSVLENDLNIGVMSAIKYENISTGTKAKLKVIHETVAYPETLELLRPDLDIEIKEKLRQLLTEKIIKDEKLTNKIKAYDGRRFERFVAEGRDGYVFLRNVIKHNVVPIVLDKK